MKLRSDCKMTIYITIRSDYYDLMISRIDRTMLFYYYYLSYYYYSIMMLVYHNDIMILKYSTFMKIY